MRLIQKVKIRLLNYVNHISKYKILYKKRNEKYLEIILNV